jgi:hypothetical protein
LPRERFQARTGIPARAMFRAIGKPMVPPAPSTATVWVDVWLCFMPAGYPRRPGVIVWGDNLAGASGGRGLVHAL